VYLIKTRIGCQTAFSLPELDYYHLHTDPL